MSTTRAPERVRTFRSTRRLPLTTAGVLILIGAITNTIISRFHPSEQDPNNHPAVFAEYAASTDWIWVHYGQFAAARGPTCSCSAASSSGTERGSLAVRRGASTRSHTSPPSCARPR